MNRRRDLWLLVMSLFLLPATGHAQEGEPCDDDVSYRVLSLNYPGVLIEPPDRSYQQPAPYRYSYIFRESFEGGDRPHALAMGAGASWARVKAGPGGRTLSVLPQPLETNLETIASDPANWLVLGPFDLSRGREGRIMAHFRLGGPSPDRPASIALLASNDGKNFHGLELSGRTCDWFYRKLDLHNVPELGSLMGQKKVWIAFLPTGSPAGNRRQLAIDNLRILTVNPDLAPETSVPVTPMKDMAPSYESLLEYYAPYLVQDLASTEFGDYITRFDFDGNYVGNDNWDHLGQNCGGGCDSYDPGCEPEYPLPAYVYGSVIETSTHYFLCYAVFHPADDYMRAAASHENDLEGVIVMVRKDGSTYGTPRMVQLQAHTDYFQYKFPAVTGIHDDNEDMDGTIDVYGGPHPVVHIEGGGHGLRATAEDGPYIHYVYTGTAVDPGFPSPYKVSTANPAAIQPSQRVGYDLLPITAGFWLRRANTCGAEQGCMYATWGDYLGGRANWNIDEDFAVQDLGTHLSGDSCMQLGGVASPPWNWSDDGDDDCLQFPQLAPCPLNGDWVLDSAWYHTWQFNWDETVSESYVYNPYIYNHLCGDLYGPLLFSASPALPYRVHGGSVWNPGITVPSGSEGLSLGSGVDLLFDLGTKLRADGEFTAAPLATDPCYLINSSAAGIVVQPGGGLRAQGGGGIRF